MLWFIVLVGLPFGLMVFTAGLMAFFENGELEGEVSRTEAGIVTSAFGLLLLLFVGYEIYRLYIIRKYPLLVFYREGIQIQVIGKWRQKKIVKSLWEDVLLMEGQGIKLINLLCKTEKDESEDVTEEKFVSYHTLGVLYTAESFGVSLKKVVQSFDYYQNDPDARKALPSWEGWDTVFSGHPLPTE